VVLIRVLELAVVTVLIVEVNVELVKVLVLTVVMEVAMEVNVELVKVRVVKVELVLPVWVVMVVLVLVAKVVV
jgi:hypothetical protein